MISYMDREQFLRPLPSLELNAVPANTALALGEFWRAHARVLSLGCDLAEADELNKLLEALRSKNGG